MGERRPRRTGHDELLLTLALARRRERSRGGGGRRLAAILVAVGLAGGAAVLGGAALATAGAVHSALTDCTLAGRTPRPLPETSFVFAANGAYLGAIHDVTYREPVAYDRISPWARRATVAAEDRTFWTNDGLDYPGIARAALADLRAGQVVEGASTITQQLVRNLYLSDRRTLERKRLEACLALKLTRARAKAAILAEYLNRVPYGHRAVGIEAASRTFFGRHARQLTPAQAALLAGLPQAPTRYDPFVHADAALRRRNDVLRAMRETGALSAPAYRRAMVKPLGLHPGYAYTIRRHPGFFAYVQSRLVAAYGERRVREGGLSVYTTLDGRAQRLARRAIRRNLGRRHDPAAALVSINPWNGAITAMVSEAHRHRLQFDLAAQGKRQTGSAFKPFVLVDAVWKKHADPDRTWYDSAPFTYQPTARAKPWRPHTYENRFLGPETLTKATLLSDNVVYAKLTLDVGPRSVARIAHRMGIRSHLQPVASIGLGSNSVTPLELAAAYATLASGGLYHRPYAIRKVMLPDGRVDRSRRWGPRRPKRVLPPGVASVVTRVLEENVQRGTGVAARLPRREVAGKTGTTSRWTDAWFAGYTPRRATVVWVGYPRRARPMADVHGIHVVGGSFPAAIWHDFTRGALVGRRPLSFRRVGWPMHAWHGRRGLRRSPPRR